MKVYYNPNDTSIFLLATPAREGRLQDAIFACLEPSRDFLYEDPKDREINLLHNKIENLESFITKIVVTLVGKKLLSIEEVNDALPKGAISE